MKQGFLAALLLIFIVSSAGCGVAKTPSTSTQLTTGTVTATITYKLELQSWSWHEDYGYAIAEGEIKNISSSRMENVEAVISWYTEDGEFITSDSALIEYDPIMPGQTSPFKVTAKYNPAMNKARPGFKFLMGESIDWTKAGSTTTTTATIVTMPPITPQ
jgi:hypothetical protein